ncbi:hypothetical protein COCMIDRAFT_83969 [Bipolaris oryzae ATCC 44560]|uniref:NAD(P)-binding protein n=1 Tax=Bipolaris oryzae ATCC 44560 TaxID=930090 RepID=W6ZIE3_COCMI|nr:uncharacterized protein COCMIDRAFT_83969 [Bipolaris oryzae ATCC 44560]EUC49708.1 hypothetical protein COCMIDRAFT_83969 [Bipolaris oryzae ATCC 44560]
MTIELSPLHAPHFAATKSAEEIYERLRADEELIDAQKVCSWVAWYLPDYDTDLGRAIARCLAPMPGVNHDLRRLIYENCLSKIRQDILPEELATALKVLVHLQDKKIIRRDTTAESITTWLHEQVATRHEIPTTNIPEPPPVPRKRLCYICRLEIKRPFPSHPSMCMPCGAFNHASSQISLPPKMTLVSDFTALVTGARVNLGYHTALRLLRCGGRVIATSRYPRDAISRYTKEADSGQWIDRLKVVGADFRSARDAFELVREVKECLKQWADGGEPRLYALINNAAQTLTDSIKKEERAMEREQDLKRRETDPGLLLGENYTARVRGGALPLALENGKAHSTWMDGPENDTDAIWILKEVETSKGTTTEIETYTKSSWVQGMSEIPYEDVGSALSVNTFVPFILCRELLPLMGITELSPAAASGMTHKPQGYVINVSSREGIFEDILTSTAKRGKHVHTNMSKAALNMLTETEAEPAWRTRRVAMNTVDPGYMSAAPEYEDAFDGRRPIGWEDGAGRVLWPIAVAEIEGLVVRGRFLKHYGAVEVDPGRGRG